MSANENETGKKTKHRSPSYPLIPIDEAITRVRQIYQHDKRANTTYNAILEHMGYSTKSQKGRSGTSGRVVAALRMYGLLDEPASGQFRVSDLGFRILNLPEESEERAELVRKVALTPPVFQKLLAYYKGEIPSDAALRSHLVLNEGFNPDYVDQFIRSFRRTINVANPSPADYNTGEESEEGEPPPEGGRLLSSLPPAPPPARGFSGLQAERTPPRRAVDNEPPYFGGPPREGKELRFNIARDSEASVTFNGPVTQEAIGKLIVLLQASQDTFPTKAELEQPQPAPQPQRPETSPASQLFGDLDEE